MLAPARVQMRLRRIVCGPVHQMRASGSVAVVSGVALGFGLASPGKAYAAGENSSTNLLAAISGAASGACLIGARAVSTAAQGPRVIVVAGPSGVGKGTLIGKLMDAYPGQFGFSVSHTTRSPRAGEIDGVHYHFRTVAQVESGIKANEFIEYAAVHGNYYGTTHAAVKDVVEAGKGCILDIDVQGVKSVRDAWKSSPKPVFIFIKPPGKGTSVLEQRLRKRGTENDAQIEKRLRTAQTELAFCDSEEGKATFDAVIVNDDLESAFAEFCAAIL